MPEWLVMVLTGCTCLGAACALADLGNRLFGSYARRPVSVALRMSAVTLAALALIAPVLFHVAMPGSEVAAIGLIVSAAISAVIIFHFLFPIRWRIRRGTLPGPGTRTDLGPGLQLNHLSLPPGTLALRTPSLDILVISDLHCNTRGKLEQLRSALGQLRETEVDLVLMLGDFGENTKLLPEAVDLIASLPARRGRFAVWGNHDHEGGRLQLLQGLLANAGITVLANRSVAVPELGVTLVGLDTPWTSGPLPSPPDGELILGLSHSPDNIKKMATLGAHLVFAGHTHGGRLRLPLIGPLLVPSLFGRFLNEGLFSFRDTRMYVTPGVGYFLRPGGRNGEVLKMSIAAENSPEA